MGYVSLQCFTLLSLDRLIAITVSSVTIVFLFCHGTEFSTSSRSLRRPLWNSQAIDRHQPVSANQQLRLPTNRVSQKNNDCWQVYFSFPSSSPSFLSPVEHTFNRNLFLSPTFLCLRIQDGGHTIRENVLTVLSPKIRLHCRLPKAQF